MSWLATLLEVIGWIGPGPGLDCLSLLPWSSSLCLYLCLSPLAWTYLYAVGAREIPVALDFTVLAKHAGENARGFLGDVGIGASALRHGRSRGCSG